MELSVNEKVPSTLAQSRRPVQVSDSTEKIITYAGLLALIAQRSRKQRICWIRSIYCARARELGYTYNCIAESLGRRDHTTILSSVESYSVRIDFDTAFTAFARYWLSVITDDFVHWAVSGIGGHEEL